MTQLRLDVDQLVDEALATAGSDDFGEPTWREGLERLVEGLRDESALNELGVQIAAGEILEYLTNRLCVTDWHRRHPEMATADIEPPIVIIGQARTGTTILHDLLGEDPRNRVPLSWEVDRPCPPPETATYESDPRIDEVQALMDGSELLIPGFKAIHPIGARLPQECVRMTGGEFRSVIFPTQYRLPSYARWVLYEADMAPAYRWHRAFLQFLQFRHPAERWVLKSPGHVWSLEALMVEYPNALLVQTHRDPLQIIASLGSLLPTLRQLASDDTSGPEAAREFTEYILDGLDRTVDARENGLVPRDRVVDVQFRSFMRNPFDVIGTIYERLGLELTEDAESRMRAFLADNPRDKHGTHSYTFSQTGLDEGELRARASRYQDFFDVPSEELA